MRILILGAGQVGSSVAASLAGEANDITIVDSNPDSLRHLQEHFDLRTLTGFASHPDVLRRAGAEHADMLLAVTNSDETNMIACQVAFHLFDTPTRIARVRARSYLSQPTLFEPGCLAIDELISPEQEVTNHIERIIEYPGTLQVLEFADGIVLMVAVRAYHGGPLVGHALRTLSDHLPTVDARVAAIYRRGRAIIPNGDTVIEADDEVFFVAAREDIGNVLGELRNRESRVRTVMLAGGGNIGRRLAQALEPSYRVKLIERSDKVVTRLSEELDRTVVLRGDAADEDLLLEENIDRTDVFCAVTNDDQANILSAMLAKRLGAGKVMSLINRGVYADLVQGNSIDIAFSPAQTTIGTLLARVRRGDVVAVHSLRRGAAEAIEAIAHGTRHTSRVIGRQVDAIDLPPDTTITTLVRDGEVVMAHHDTVIEADDHVILFLLDKRRVPDVEQLFQITTEMHYPP